MEKLLLLSFIVCSVSFTITVTSIFKFLREYVSTLHSKLEELIHCPYCLGHYITIILLFIVDYSYDFCDWQAMNFILTIFCIMGITSMMHYIVLRTYEPIAKQIAIRKIEKLKSK